MEEAVSQRQFAKMMNYSPSQVRNWIASGRISENSLTSTDSKSAKIIVMRAKKDLANTQPGKFAFNSDPEKKKKTRHNREERLEQSEENESTFTAPAINSSEDTYLSYTQTELNKIKLIREIQMQDIKIGELTKKLVEWDLVYRAQFKAFRDLRDAIEAVPDRIINDILAARNERHAIHQILINELKDTLDRYTHVENTF